MTPLWPVFISILLLHDEQYVLYFVYKEAQPLVQRKELWSLGVILSVGETGVD